MTTHLVHAWWDTTSFSPHYQTAPEPDFQWTVDRGGGPVNWFAWSPDLNPLDFWLWGHLKTLAYSTPINEFEVLQQRMPDRRIEWNQEFLINCTPLCNEELKVVLKCVGTTQSICCRDHTNIGHISAGIGFWIFGLAHLMRLYPIKACNPFNTLYRHSWTCSPHSD
jgi:hypothetical protein